MRVCRRGVRCMSGERPGSAQEFPKGTNQTCYCAEMFVPWCALRLFDAENVAKPIPLLLVPARDSSLDPRTGEGWPHAVGPTRCRPLLPESPLSDRY
jgi:hypothetical protein